MVAFRSSVYQPNDKTDKFIVCFIQKADLVDAAGNIVVHNWAEQLHAVDPSTSVDELDGAVNRCNVPEPDSTSMHALKVWGCLIERGYKTVYAGLIPTK